MLPLYLLHALIGSNGKGMNPALHRPTIESSYICACSVIQMFLSFCDPIILSGQSYHILVLELTCLSLHFPAGCNYREIKILNPVMKSSLFQGSGTKCSVLKLKGE